jgi:hypothetical protein
MGYDSTILVKVDRKTKRGMDSIDVNWSGRIRDFIKRELMKKARLNEAERIRQSLFRKGPGLESVEVLRKMRGSRHGAGSN